MKSSSEWDTSSSRRQSLAFLGALIACLSFTPAPAGAKVFLAQEEALKLAFPGADRVSEDVYILKPDQKEAIEKRARSPLEGELVTVFTGWKGGEVQGYASIDVHEVRTFPEALMVVISPGGKVQSARVLAFYEPMDYLPAERWFRQFLGVSKDDDLRLGWDIQGISGATLSARVATDSVRRFLAVYETLIAPRQDAAADPPEGPDAPKKEE